MPYIELSDEMRARRAIPSDLPEAAQEAVRRALEAPDCRVSIFGNCIAVDYEDGWWQGAMLKRSEIAEGAVSGAVYVLQRARASHLAGTQKRKTKA